MWISPAGIKMIVKSPMTSFIVFVTDGASLVTRRNSASFDFHFIVSYVVGISNSSPRPWHSISRDRQSDGRVTWESSCSIATAMSSTEANGYPMASSNGTNYSDGVLLTRKANRTLLIHSNPGPDSDEYSFSCFSRCDTSVTDVWFCCHASPRRSHLIQTQDCRLIRKRSWGRP